MGQCCLYLTYLIFQNFCKHIYIFSAYNVFFKYERERLVRETMLKDNVDKDKVEELIAIRDKTKTGKRVHRKTHG